MFRKRKTPEESRLEMLDPRHVPSGGRRMSGKPLLFFLLLLFGCVAVGGYVLYDRSQRTITQGAQEQKRSSSAASFATELAGSGPASGVVPAARPPQMPELPQEQPKVDAKQETPSPVPALASPPVAVNPWAEHASRLNDTRFAALESALKSRTGVLQSGMSPPSAQPRQTDTRRMVPDPSAAYQSRLAELKGVGGEGGAPGNELLQGDNGRNEITGYARSAWSLPNELESSTNPYMLRAGFIIPAIMISGISSNLPGQVMAQVSQNVYDSATGKHVLIPQGTRLVGTYNSDVGYGQERVLMVWQRLLFPDGRTLDIQAMPGADNAGYAGFEDQVDNHYIRTFSSAFLLSGVIAAVAMSQDSNNNTGDRQRASDSLSEALGQTLGSTMAEMIRKNLNIAPTLKIRPGYRFNVMVTKDMTFPGPYRIFSNQRGK